MPQWRKFHTKTTDSMDFNDMPDDFTRLMWCLLPLKCCREGRGIDMPQWIKAQLFPLRSDVALEQIENAMRQYHELGMIERYCVNGRPYYEIVNWHIYQSTDREAKSPYPQIDKNAVKKRKDLDLEVDLDIDIDASQMSCSGVSQELLVSESDYEKICAVWGRLFPDKPQPRSDNKTLQGKIKTRMKSVHFQENWRAALEKASQSTFLNCGTFFDLGWFLQNDNHYENCLNGKYAERTRQSKAQTNFQAGQEVLNDIRR